MGNIVYEEELISEDVFKGELSLEQELTVQQQNKLVFQMMRDAGIEVGDEKEYRIGYKNDSQPHKYHFVVTRTYKKEIPYRKTREEIYSGIWPLDGIKMTPEQQHQKAIEMMKQDGVDVLDEDELEVGYTGADDNDGLSETQTSRFVVYKIKKEKLTPEEAADLEKEETLKNLYVEFRSLRDRMKATTNATEMAQLAERIETLSKKMDELVAESTRDYGPFETALAEINKQIESIRKIQEERQKRYEESYTRIQGIMEEYSKMVTEGTNTEYDKKIQELITQSKTEHEQSMTLRSEIESRTEELKALLKKKKKIERDLQNAQQLGLSAQEYQELADGFKKRKLISAIIEKKGLGDLLAIPDKERTPEQKRQIKAIRQQIKEELAKEKREKPEVPILDLVEALYGIETEVKLRGKQRILIVRPSTIDTIKKNASKMPEKIKTPNGVDRTYKPGDAPEDMREVMESREEPIRDIITFFVDENYPGKVFVRDNVFDRFGIEKNGPIVHINGILCRELSQSDKDEIFANQENSYSPYTVRTVEGSVEEQLEGPKVYNLTPGEPKKDEILPSEESDELIPGTNFKRPRARRDDESDEDYVAFLKDYYGRVFGNPEETLSSAGTGLDNPTGDVIPPATDDDNPTDTDDDNPTETDDDNPTEADDDNPTETDDDNPTETDDDNPTATDDDNPTATDDDNPTGTGDDNPTETDEEKEETLQGRGVTDIITIFRDKDDPSKMYAYKPVFDRFDAEKIGEEVRLEGIAGYEISQEDVDYIEANKHNTYSPYEVVYREITITKGKITPPMDEPPKDKIIIYEDEEEAGKFYATDDIFGRFQVSPIGDEVMLEGQAGHEIASTDVQDIDANKDNSTPPYEVEYRKVKIPKKTSQTAIDTIVIYEDEDEPGKFYATDDIFGKFQVSPIGDEVILEGQVGHEIAATDVRDIDTNKANSTPPYEVEYRKIKLQKKTPQNIEYVTLFRDLNDNNQVYAPDAIMRKFGVALSGEPTDVNGIPCHKISSDTDQIINSIARTSKNPKLEVRYVDVHIKKLEPPHVRPHVEAILDKLTTGLDIRAKDAKRYQASNLRISKGFRDELHSGNYVYNIVHVVPAVLKAGMGLFRKLAGKLMTGKRAKESMKTIEERLAKLSEEELDVLFEEYKGSQLKTDMNNQINPLILERLRQHGMARVAKLNEAIKQDYIILFTLLGQIKALEEQIQNNGGNNPTLDAQRQALMKQASQHVQSIVENRKKANNILSSGVHGIEEDFKAVSTKLSYVGMRFAKANDFDTELQHKLGEFGSNLNTAIANGDDEATVQNFMALESCYYENTRIKGSIAGRRSVGSKYYSPVAEQFDYRDDPFIRDLFTTIAVTSAAVSAINAIRIHQIEAQRVLNDQRQQVGSVNAQNQATMNTVHQTGQQISGKRGTFRDGMEAQAEHDILTNADVRERAHLDSTDWHFNSVYRVTDDAGHAAYNQFGADVTSQINAVTSDYAQGLITQAEALQRMSQISSNAQSTLRQVVDDSLQILRPYSVRNPQFDLTAVEQSMNYIVTHPNAIADMNQAMVDVTNLADGLQALQATPFAALSSLPSDMATTIVGAASAAVLASNVAATMSRPNRKGRYGNEITSMMDDYLSEQQDPQQSRTY